MAHVVPKKQHASGSGHLSDNEINGPDIVNVFSNKENLSQHKIYLNKNRAIYIFLQLITVFL